MEEQRKEPQANQQEKTKKFGARKNRKGKIIGASLLGLALVACVIITLLPGGNGWKTVFSFFGVTDFSQQADGYPFALHVLDVGKADAILVECEGNYLLIDGGTVDRGTEVCRYLTRRGVKTLDYVINTHPDKDHIGGLGQVIRTFPVNAFVSPELSADLTPDNNTYRTVMTALEQGHIVRKNAAAGDTLPWNGAMLEVLAPVSLGDSTNNNSLVLRITYGEHVFLLMGDAEEDEEKELLQSGEKLRADVLKVGHHGSDTSTTKALLEAVQPQWAAVSVGEDSNELPKKSVLKRLADAGAEIYRTDLQGTLLFVSDGTTIKIFTENAETWS